MLKRAYRRTLCLILVPDNSPEGWPPQYCHARQYFSCISVRDIGKAGHDCHK